MNWSPGLNITYKHLQDLEKYFHLFDKKCNDQVNEIYDVLISLNLSVLVGYSEYKVQIVCTNQVKQDYHGQLGKSGRS